MLKELLELVQGSAQKSVINNPEIPNELNNTVVAEATNTVASGLRNVVAGGGLQSLLSLFGGGSRQNGNSLLNNPIVSMMVGHFAEKLMSKHSLGGEQAGNVANTLIPDVLGKLINQIGDPNDNTFTLENLLGSITGGRVPELVGQGNSGGQSFSIGDLLGQNGGGQSNGNVLTDLISQFARGAQSQQQRNGGGGLMDLIQGYLK